MRDQGRTGLIKAWRAPNVYVGVGLNSKSVSTVGNFLVTIMGWVERKIMWRLEEKVSIVIMACCLVWILPCVIYKVHYRLWFLENVKHFSIIGAIDLAWHLPHQKCMFCNIYVTSGYTECLPFFQLFKRYFYLSLWTATIPSWNVVLCRVSIQPFLQFCP